LCSEEKFYAGPLSRAGPVNAITWKIFSPASRDPGIAKLIFVAFNRGAEISAKHNIYRNQTIFLIWKELIKREKTVPYKEIKPVLDRGTFKSSQSCNDKAFLMTLEIESHMMGPR
jgi:hypothetical protein